MSKDFGVDFELELVDIQNMTGCFLKIQIKAVTQIKIIDYKINLRIKNNFLKYCADCRTPVILILIDVNNEIGYYIWVQYYLFTNKINLNNTKTTNIFFSIYDEVAMALNRELKTIALGLNHFQLQSDLQASLASAFFLGDVEIYGKLNSLVLEL